MKPYYSDSLITLYHGDCREILPQLDVKADICITSPPYNMGGTSLGYQPNSTVGQKLYGEYSDNLTSGEYVRFLLDVLTQCLECSTYTFWNMQMVASTKKPILELLHECAGNLKDIFIWKKQAVAQIAVANALRFATGFEFVFCFGEDDSRIFKHGNFPENGYVPNIQEWHKSESFPEHHATFPRELPDYFIRHFTFDGMTILDPFLGSGTTAVAAKMLKRKCIGIEISEKYLEIAANRLNRPIPLFDKPEQLSLDVRQK